MNKSEEESTHPKIIIIPPLNALEIKKPISISLDFDGVIHSYSKGWQDGSIYDQPIPGSIEFIGEVMWKHQISVFVLSTRNPYQIKEWFDNVVFKNKESLFSTKIIPDNLNKWEEKCVLGITNRKLVASVYIDDRSLTFDGDFSSLLPKIFSFKTWMNR